LGIAQVKEPTSSLGARDVGAPAMVQLDNLALYQGTAQDEQHVAYRPVAGQQPRNNEIMAVAMQQLHKYTAKAYS
jgi:hypothetical protein